MKFNLIQCDKNCDIIEFILELKDMAKTVYNYQDDCINDYRYMAEHEMQDIIEKLLNFEV